MKSVLSLVFLSLFLCANLAAQEASPSAAATKPNAPTEEKTVRRAVFRANKDQIKQVQTMLRAKGLYSGDAVGKLDADTRSAIKAFQKDNGLRETGTLNRATLEKMGIELTEKQKAFPVDERSYAVKGDASAAPSPATSGTVETKKRQPPFRATKDQVIAAQKALRAASIYTGEETGKLDDATRDGLKKYQEANALKVTGTLNQATLEKMGIELTDRQKASAAAQPEK